MNKLKGVLYEIDGVLGIIFDIAVKFITLTFACQGIRFMGILLELLLLEIIK